MNLSFCIFRDEWFNILSVDIEDEVCSNERVVLVFFFVDIDEDFFYIWVRYCYGRVIVLVIEVEVFLFYECL